MANSSTDSWPTRPSAVAADDRVTRPSKRLMNASVSTPDEIAWLRRAETAKTLPETLVYLSQMLFFNPYHSLARRKMYQSLQRLLQKDAFLGYIDETESFYRVRNATGLPLVVPNAFLTI